MNLPNYSSPHPDELLLSCFLRNLSENAISLHFFESSFIKSRSFRFQEKHFTLDLRHEFRPFYSAITPSSKVIDFFLNTSTYPFHSIFMTEAEQTAYINAFFRDADKLNTFARSILSSISICPQCAQEDAIIFGHPYLHRVHQLPGICYCPKHRVCLLQYHGKYDRLIEYDSNDFAPIAVNTGISVDDYVAYAEYSQVLLCRNVKTNISNVKAAIRSAFAERGYRARHYSTTFYKDLNEWKHRPLFNVPEQKLSVWLSIIQEKPISDILALLMFLYPDPEALINRLDNGCPLISEFKCDLGHTYIATPHAQKSGWGCPECDKSLTYDERYARLVQVLGAGEYAVKEQFTSMDHKTKLYHCICASDVYLKPRLFIFYGHRCRCSMRIPEEDVREEVESYGFELVSYTNATDRMTVFHPKCGQTFQITKAGFTINPYCRCCEAFAPLDVGSLVGDEYDLVSYDKTRKTVVIKHNSCGRCFEIGRDKFQSGQRCPQCTVIPGYDEIDRVLQLSSSGRYKLTGLSDNKRNVLVLDTETGKTRSHSRELLAQELSRPTASALYPGLRTGYHFPDWKAYLKLYKEYCQMFGKPPSRKDDYKGVALGVWAMEMRKKRRQGYLSDDRIRVMTDAGFQWE